MATLWRNWVVANIVGEVVGFGAAGALMILVGEAIAALDDLAQLIASAAAVVLLGTVEGTAVGLAQFTVLGRTFASLSRRAWLVGTIGGAVLAWGCGMAIGTFAGDAFAASTDMPIVAALVIGAVAGALLGGPQWLVLRRARVHARWWVPAHAFAWSVGMVVAFAGVGALPSSAAFVFTAIAMAGTGLGMGALVAAITGLALVDAARLRPSPAPATP